LVRAQQGALEGQGDRVNMSEQTPGVLRGATSEAHVTGASALARVKTTAERFDRLVHKLLRAHNEQNAVAELLGDKQLVERLLGAFVEEANTIQDIAEFVDSATTDERRSFRELFCSGSFAEAAAVINRVLASMGCATTEITM
jgi:hypothetical protein